MIKILLLISLMFSSAFAETRQKIVVIDTGIGMKQAKMPFMCENGVLSTTGDKGFDQHGHGINIIGLIAQKMDRTKYCIVSIKFHPGNKPISGKVSLENLMAAFDKAYDLNPTIVNLSLNGPVPEAAEFAKIMKLLRNGTKINVAAGNDKRLLTKTSCSAFPACYKTQIPESYLSQFKVIGANDTPHSNHGEIVDEYLKGAKIGFPAMTGTSQATAVFTSQMTSP